MTKKKKKRILDTLVGNVLHVIDLCCIDYIAWNCPGSRSSLLAVYIPENVILTTLYIFQSSLGFNLMNRSIWITSHNKYTFPVLWWSVLWCALLLCVGISVCLCRVMWPDIIIIISWLIIDQNTRPFIKKTKRRLVWKWN